MEIVGVAAVAAIVWLVLESRNQSGTNGTGASATSTSGTTQTTTQGTPAAGAAAGAVVGAITGVAKLAGQPGNPGTNAGGISLATRISGGVLAATGIVTAITSHSTQGRLIGGAETGAGIGTNIVPGIGTAIGAGIGALVGWIGGINANDTKEARWDLCKRLGYTRDGNGFDKMVRTDLAMILGPYNNIGHDVSFPNGARFNTVSEGLWAEAVGRIGRKDTTWNQDWTNRFLTAYTQGTPVHIYADNPTKGAGPVA